MVERISNTFESVRQTLSVVTPRPWQRTTLRFLFSGVMAAGAALLLSRERFGDTGAAVALFIVGVTSWFAGPGPAAICPFVLLLVGSFVQANESNQKGESATIAVVNLVVVTVLFVGIGWAGKLKRKALSDLREREVRLRMEARHKDHFLATLAHELRNPLSPLSSGLELLEHSRRLKLSVTEIDNTHAMMRRQLDHLVRLIDDLLDINRINTGKIDLQRQRLSLNHIVRDAVESARPQITALNHHFTTNVLRPEIFVDGDRARLLQVVSNLLNNAAKFTPPQGSISLEIDCDEQHARIKIVDSGIGIAPEVLPRVFEMFAQFDNPLTKKHGGLGIGLNLSRRLVEMHGGTIEAQSSGLGKGSQFIVRLPVMSSEVDGRCPAG